MQRLVERRYLVAMVVTAAAYYAAARIGLHLAYPHTGTTTYGAVTAFWPPVGIGIAALVLFVHSVFPGVAWLANLVDLFSTVAIPIDGGSFGLVVLLLIMGGALARGKRVGWLFTVIAFGIILLGDLLAVLLLVTASFVGSLELVDLPALARVAFNFASLGALCWVLIAYRGEFSAPAPAAREAD